MWNALAHADALLALSSTSSLLSLPELAAADEAVAAPAAATTLATLTASTTDLKQRLAGVGATLGRIEARVERVRRKQHAE